MAASMSDTDAATMSKRLPADSALNSYRAWLLFNGSTYNSSNVPQLPRLPVLNESNRAEHADWHAYIENIYGKGVQFPVDLNTFTWFYWSSPLRLPAIFLCDWFGVGSEVAHGTPWTGGLAAWSWGPEHSTRRAGFFVHRAHQHLASYNTDDHIEVMRTGPGPMSAYEGESARLGLWFLHAIGSNVFLRPSTLANLEVAFDARYDLKDVAATNYYTETGAVSPRVPRVELAAFINSTDGAFQFWPADLHLEHHDGTPCHSTSRQTRLLTCEELNVPIWPGDDPLPTRNCVETESTAWSHAQQRWQRVYSNPCESDAEHDEQ